MLLSDIPKKVKNIKREYENRYLFMDLIISDIHADIKGLESILRIVESADFIDRYGKFSRILCLGDILERGTSPKQVLDKLKELSSNYTVESVMGNHDEAHMYNRRITGSSLESIDNHNKLDQADLEFFPENKDGTYGQQQFIDTKHNVICVHGGPLEPEEIMPKDDTKEDINDPSSSWLYQKTWQRISEEDFEFFSYTGYHYRPLSAFNTTSKHSDNFMIFCGHQHKEHAIEYNCDNAKIKNILDATLTKKEKIEDMILNRKEIMLQPKKRYIFRVGMAGPQGYYGKGHTRPHFGFVDYDSNIVRLFSVNKSGMEHN